MNFTCLCFDLKYSFKINCCNLLHISFGISEIWSCCCLLMPSDSVVDKSPPNSWCDNILCRTTLIDTAPPLPATGINLRCCDLGSCSTNVRTQITRPHCVGLAAPDAGHRPLLRPADRTGAQKLTKEQFISGEIQWILSTNKDNGHYC